MNPKVKHRHCEMRPQRRGGEDRDGRWKLIERTCLYFGEEVKTGGGGSWICQTEKSLRITNKFITWSTALFILLEKQKKVAGFFLISTEIFFALRCIES